MFTDTERLIFPYEVRGQKRWADPLAISRNLIRASNGEFDQIDAESRDVPDGVGGFAEQGPQGPEEFGKVLSRASAREKRHAFTCAAFGLPPFDPATGEGVTEVETAAVLDSFLVWLEGNERPGAASPEAAPRTATPPATP